MVILRKISMLCDNGLNSCCNRGYSSPRTRNTKRTAARLIEIAAQDPSRMPVTAVSGRMIKFPQWYTFQHEALVIYAQYALDQNAPGI